jgi:S1-C subfamily serine protease
MCAYWRVEISAVDLAAAEAGFTQSATAGGATIVSYFPELGWRYPRVSRGAIVTKLGPGPLQDAGVSEGDVVLAIDGRDVADPASFARLVGEELARLDEHGGLLHVLVQPQRGESRELSYAIASRRSPPSAAPTATTGSVNVWDRVGGNRGTGRDDPGQ